MKTGHSLCWRDVGCMLFRVRQVFNRILIVFILDHDGTAFSNDLFFNRIVNLHRVFKVSKGSAERAQKSRVVGDEHGSDAFVMVDVRARCDE